jgi:enoyl-CoA hydratase/carnithine racemase
VSEIVQHLNTLSRDVDVAAIVVTGRGLFRGWHDIAEMAEMSPTDHVRLDTTASFMLCASHQRPVIAAVQAMRWVVAVNWRSLATCRRSGGRSCQPEIRRHHARRRSTQRLLRSAGPYGTMVLDWRDDSAPAAFAAIW